MDQIILDALGAERAQTFGDIARECETVGVDTPGAKATQDKKDE